MSYYKTVIKKLPGLVAIRVHDKRQPPSNFKAKLVIKTPIGDDSILKLAHELVEELSK